MAITTVLTRLPKYLNPASTFAALHTLDAEHPSHTAPRETSSRTTLIVLFSVCLSLLLLNYGKNASSLNTLLSFFSTLFNLPSDYLLQKLRSSHFASLTYLTWWTFCHVVTFVIIPAIVVKLFFTQKFVDMGWRWGETHKHWQGYAVLLSPIIVMVILVSFREDFVQHYPFYYEAGRSWTDFLVWELLYLLQFACLEFFFRGYMLQTLRPHYGSAAIWIMIVPYLMIHFTKPWLEATGAIFFGLFLGILALRSRSIWGGFCVHAGVALSMDIASLIQQGRIPQQWLP